jgi:hypothetical protein
MTRRKRSPERPPRGTGHYSTDGGAWWDDARARWFRTTDRDDVLEIEVEDVAGRSLLSSLVTTLVNQNGAGYYRFVGRARSADQRWPTYSIPGGTFALVRQLPDDLEVNGPRSGDAVDRLAEMRRQLAGEGWRPAGRGEHWWSYRYTRPDLDWAEPADRLYPNNGHADSHR